jgi:transposase
MEADELIIKNRIETVLPILNEKQSRIYLASEAKSIGWGGKSKISILSGISRAAIARGEKDIKETNIEEETCRIRKPGGGRKKEVSKNIGLSEAIKQIVEPHTVGDPENLLLWTSKSVRKIKGLLDEQGYKISHELIRQILRELGYSLQTNRKTKEWGEHPDRDAQFEFINKQSKEFIRDNLPVISVDCKKKELIGNYKNGGKEWQPVKNPVEVNVYDFVDKTNGKASPYGVYDIAKNKGWMSVGISSDTAAFAMATIRSWWENEGKNTYQDSDKLYITADGGGSNGSRNRLWKSELQQFANDTGLKIYVSHFPPGTSKWNKIEHRLFSYISINWRGKPLTSLAVIIGLINSTNTETGLTVRAVLDNNIYKTGIKIEDKVFEKINIETNDFCGQWNYIIKPNCNI